MTKHDNSQSYQNTVFSFSFSWIRCPNPLKHQLKIIFLHHFYFGFDRLETWIILIYHSPYRILLKAGKSQNPLCWIRCTSQPLDAEIESAVVEDDAYLVLGVRGRARYAQAYVPKRRCTIVFHVCFSAGCCTGILRCIAGGVPLGMGCARMPYFTSKKLKTRYKESLMSSTKPASCVELAVLDSEIMACLPSPFRRQQGGAPPHVMRSWDRGGTAAPRRGSSGCVGCCDMRKSLARPLTSFRKATIE